MKDLLGAIDEAPTVAEVDGEIVILGERVGVAYTVAAARELKARLERVLGASAPARLDPAGPAA
ncbi:MAG: hypothetical protein H2038_00725 [Brevundimonas sp.]|uniref:hypothetical protein n=1 Tax=Brevundimonas sp. TaxID=1871086 RepID=UPI001821AA6D|nr:hypothetical protein [Brevundimonas sp.]MBA4803156.1 hypothetical protein [Brevundimonas sp.]